MGQNFIPGSLTSFQRPRWCCKTTARALILCFRKLPSIALGTIEGSVLDSALDIGVPSRIIATRDRWTTVDKFGEPRSYVADTDSLGNFTIGNLLPGSYFVFAVPLGSYAPAFYSADTVTTRWKRATKVVISGNTVKRHRYLRA